MDPKQEPISLPVELFAASVFLGCWGTVRAGDLLTTAALYASGMLWWDFTLKLIEWWKQED